MSGQAMWALVIVAVITAALLGFFFGRVSTKGVQQKLRETEHELARKDAEISSYKQEVDAHFDQTATLFMSMAGSYKSLFEHLSSGYERLSDQSSRDLFRERVATLLLDGPPAATVVAETPAPENFVETPVEATEAVPVVAEPLLEEPESGPVGPADIAESEEREAQKVDPVQADAEAAAAMDAERREPGEYPQPEAVELPPVVEVPPAEPVRKD